jgi:hypothetical protein
MAMFLKYSRFSLLWGLGVILTIYEHFFFYYYYYKKINKKKILYDNFSSKLGHIFRINGIVGLRASVSNSAV